MKIKNILQMFFVLFITYNINAQSNAYFYYFEYKGKDELFNQQIDSKNYFFNPIISGFYPDPSICKKGNTFYLVHSSFSFFPGIPIFKSKDLVNWQQIGHVLDRPSQLKLDGIRISGGIYAPSIDYNVCDDTFYLITTLVDGGGNFIVKTKNPEKGWSDPVFIPTVGGIDPSLFFDDDGKTYIVHNDAPEGTPEYEGHRALWLHQFDIKTNKTFGERKMIVDGGVDKSKKPIWIEGPHLYKKNGKYLLIAAEGGTSVNHSQVAFISENVFGPYMPYKNNPILTQRDLPEIRENKITSVGHADIIEDNGGKTWAVFLGCRPYKDNYYNTGRETFLLPVKWDNDFPVILDKNKPLPIVVKKSNKKNKDDILSGNFTWRDEFNQNKLDYNWIQIRTPYTKWYKLSKGKLVIEPKENSIYDIGAEPSFLGRRQQHTTFSVETEFSFEPSTPDEMAGLVCYQNEKYNFFFGKTIENGKNIIVVDRTENTTSRVVQMQIPETTYNNDKIKLKIEGQKDLYSFYVSFDNITWIAIAKDVDATNISTQSAGGFVGTLIGLYAKKK
ncbi:conserved hypothetical protein [uncultured Paludibacter sp.]|uniref:Beta-xylosidase C-terminal Concanavalin A-like domain-containing protein n=1 Tax=uncultured Paludibacter sp. TaxID=497635 RepID=A0A653AK01_9BACT|nr:conserved hypothetical protein [uncultured Paludibacter sp.]